jgi:hypothetical protein
MSNELETTCPRCGIVWTASATVIEKRNSRGMKNPLFCEDCLGKVKKSECRPWTGDVDLDTFAPLQNGKPYKPGIRICGRMDCVASKHIVTPLDDLQKMIKETIEAGHKPCTMEGCGRPIKSVGLCEMHYRRDYRANGPLKFGRTTLADVVDAYDPEPKQVRLCKVIGCGKHHRAKGLCRYHYSFLYRQMHKIGI